MVQGKAKMKPTKRERDRKTNEAALSLRRGRREVAILEAEHAVGFVMAGVEIEYCDIKKDPSRSGFTQPLKRFVHVDGKVFEKVAVAYLAGGASGA
jgi:HEPN domain-containing protein